MIRKTLIIGMIISLMTCACTSQQTPTTSSLDIQQTAEAAAFTMIAQTQSSIPTATSLPPTESPSSTPLPTNTTIPSPTLDPLLPTDTATFAPQSSAPKPDDCNKPLTSWEVPTARLKFTNSTTPKGLVTLSLYVVTEFGECGYLSQQFLNGGGLDGPVGSYSAGAFVDGKKDFRVFGSFLISKGSWNIFIRNEEIVAKGGCAPNC